MDAELELAVHLKLVLLHKRIIYFDVNNTTVNGLGMRIIRIGGYCNWDTTEFITTNSLNGKTHVYLYIQDIFLVIYKIGVNVYYT